jgi:hypothetical protein
MDNGGQESHLDLSENALPHPVAERGRAWGSADLALPGLGILPGEKVSESSLGAITLLFRLDHLLCCDDILRECQ